VIAKIRPWIFVVVFCGAITGCQSSPHASATCSSVLKTLAPVTERGTQRAAGTRIEVNGGNAAFAPTCVTDVPRGIVELAVRNTGQVIHNLQIAAQHIDVDIKRGATTTVRVRVGSEPVVFICSYHRNLGMIGVLIPTEG
jgi:plastocyanin